MLSPAETPTLSPAGPSPSPGGVSLSPSPYGSTGVSPVGASRFGSAYGGGGGPTISPSGSTIVSPAPGHHRLSAGGGGGGGGGYGGYGGGYNNNLPRCSMASATEMDEDDDDDDEDDENEERLAMGLSPLREGRPSSLGVGVRAGRGRDASVPRLFELSDELGLGHGTSGMRWSQLSIFDDQVGCFVGLSLSSALLWRSYGGIALIGNARCHMYRWATLYRLTS